MVYASVWDFSWHVITKSKNTTCIILTYESFQIIRLEPTHIQAKLFYQWFSNNVLRKPLSCNVYTLPYHANKLLHRKALKNNYHTKYPTPLTSGKTNSVSTLPDIFLAPLVFSVWGIASKLNLWLRSSSSLLGPRPLSLLDSADDPLSESSAWVGFTDRWAWSEVKIGKILTHFMHGMAHRYANGILKSIFSAQLSELEGYVMDTPHGQNINPDMRIRLLSECRFPWKVIPNIWYHGKA